VSIQGYNFKYVIARRITIDHELWSKIKYITTLSNGLHQLRASTMSCDFLRQKLEITVTWVNALKGELNTFEAYLALGSVTCAKMGERAAWTFFLNNFARS
jgi:hypothetical protein